LNINRLGSNKTNKIIVIIALFSLLVIIAQTFFPFEQRQATSVQRQINNNNNTYLSLSMLSTATGTGAAATGILVNIPGVLKTRKQSKCLSCYLLEIHQKYDELKKSADKKQYSDALEGLRGDIIYLLQRRDLTESQYKMLDDRIIEYLNKINNLTSIQIK
jgi:hypothetical protein